jgi:hypothetical protein
MTNNNSPFRRNQEQPKINLRAQLAALKARYDHDAVPTYVFVAMRMIENELSWREHHRVQP